MSHGLVIWLGVFFCQKGGSLTTVMIFEFLATQQVVLFPMLPSTVPPTMVLFHAICRVQKFFFMRNNPLPV